MKHSRGASKMLLAAALAAVLAISACGDDDDDSDAGSGDSGAAPIKIMTWTSLENPNYSAPQVKTAMEAAAKAINDDGGINGRQLQAEFCDTNFDPNTEAACARKAVDEDFAAVVGSTSFFPNTLPLLERGGVAYIGGQGLTPAELTSPIAFPLAGGIPGWFYGAAALALEKGVRRPALVSSAVNASQFAAQQVGAALQQAGVQAVRTVDAPVGAPDQSATAAEAANGTDGIITSAAPNDSIKVVQSLRQANYTGIISGVTALFVKDALDALGPAANGMVLTSQVTPATESDNPAVAQFTEDMDAIDPSASKDERSLMTWASVGLFAELCERIGDDITIDTVLDGMSNLEDPIDTGVTAPYSVKGKVSPLPDYPRLFNPTVVFTEVQNGQVVQTSDGYVNPFEVLRQIAQN